MKVLSIIAIGAESIINQSDPSSNPNPSPNEYWTIGYPQSSSSVIRFLIENLRTSDTEFHTVLLNLISHMTPHNTPHVASYYENFMHIIKFSTNFCRWLKNHGRTQPKISKSSHVSKSASYISTRDLQLLQVPLPVCPSHHKQHIQQGRMLLRNNWILEMGPGGLETDFL